MKKSQKQNKLIKTKNSSKKKVKHEKTTPPLKREESSKYRLQMLEWKKLALQIYLNSLKTTKNEQYSKENLQFLNQFKQGKKHSNQFNFKLFRTQSRQESLSNITNQISIEKQCSYFNSEQSSLSCHKEDIGFLRPK